MNTLDESIRFLRESIASLPKGDPNRLHALNRLSQLLGDRYEAESEPDDLNEAILWSKEVLRITDPNESQLGVYQNTLGYLYAYKFEDTEEPEYLDLAISLLESAAELAAPKSLERKGRLNNLSNLYLMRFEGQNGNGLDDLRTSIQKGRESLLDLDLQDVERPIYLGTLSNSLGTLYEIEGSPEALEEAIQKAQESLVSAQDENLPGLLHTLAALLGQRFERDGKEEDLKNAISHARSAVKKTSRRHIDRSKYQNGLANHLLDQFHLTGNETDLEEAIKLYRQSFESSSRNINDKALSSSNLGNALGDRYELKGDLNDLHGSIKNIRKAVQLTDSTSRDRAMFLGNLCCRLTAQVEQEKEILGRESHHDVATIIHEAVDAGRKAIKSSYASSANHHFYLSNLINALGVEYEITGSELLLDEAIQLGLQAQSSLVPTHRNLPGVLVNLSIVLASKSERRGSIDILNQALGHARRAVELSKTTHPDYASWLLNLSNLLCDRFHVMGDRSDLEEAIDHIRTVVHVTPLTHFRRAPRIYTLASHLGVLYQSTGISAALDESIKTLRDAVQEACNDVIQGKCLTALCGHLASRFLLSGDPEDLKAAVTSGKEAMKSLPIDKEGKASALNTINSVLILRSNDEDNISEFEHVMENGQKILSMTPIGHSRRPMYLSNLGVLWYLKYLRTNDPTHLDNGVQFSEEAKCSAGPSSPDFATYQRNYGRVLKLRFEEKQNPKDLRCALEALTEALDASNSPPLERIRAGDLAGSILAQESRWVEASSLFTKSVHLMTRLSPRSLAVEDQQHLLSQMFGLSAAAASTSLMAGLSPREAFEILETGRGVISRLAIDSRDELETLRTSYPLYYSEYEKLRNATALEPTLQESTHRGILTFTTIHESQSPRIRNYQAYTTADGHRRALDALDEFEARIRRELKEFKYFHLTPSPEQCMELAARGPVVCFAITTYRSDALIITERDIRCLPLPDVDFNDFQKAAMAMVGKDRVTNSADSFTRGTRNSKLRDTLETLWKTIVFPVLAEVGMISTTMTRRLPRIYWVASGFLALMPLHAACDDLDFAMNHAVSTYIPTLKALQLSRSLAPTTANLKQKLMIVTVPDAPEERPLHLEQELEDIKSVASSTQAFSVQHLDSPQKRDIIDNLPNNTMVHFACHGYADARNPSNGGLLVGVLPSGKSDLLSVADLARSRWQNLRLAYLSACSTARNADQNLLDESIHIASTFGLIGFPHVIGTLWDADNDAATGVSKLFYEGLASSISGDDSISFDDAVAYALHTAIVKVRVMNMQTPSSGRRRDPTKDVLAWAPFIHVGS